MASSRRKLNKKRILTIGAAAAVGVSLVVGGMVVAAENIRASYPPAVSEKVQSYYDEHVANAKPTLPGSTAAATVTVSILSDSHAFNADSWWRQTVVANKVPGLIVGAFESQPGAMSSSLAPRVEAAVSKQGKVIVQAGTNDLLSGAAPADAAKGVMALWQEIKDRGATPVAALVPPSNDFPEAVVELNAMLTEAAAAQQLAIIDVYAPVANPDGTWANGTTTDGVHSNKTGSDLMTAAALKQLPSLAG